jgi:hypothetical protein
MKNLKVLKSDTIKAQWLDIKEQYDTDDFDLEKMDYLTSDFIAQLAFLTSKGFTEIDGTSIDIYKDRVWRVIENIGLLPEYTSVDEESEVDMTDTWYINED